MWLQFIHEVITHRVELISTVFLIVFLLLKMFFASFSSLPSFSRFFDFNWKFHLTPFFCLLSRLIVVFFFKNWHFSWSLSYTFIISLSLFWMGMYYFTGNVEYCLLSCLLQLYSHSFHLSICYDHSTYYYYLIIVLLLLFIRSFKKTRNPKDLVF